MNFGETAITSNLSNDLDDLFKVILIIDTPIALRIISTTIRME